MYCVGRFDELSCAIREGRYSGAITSLPRQDNVPRQDNESDLYLPAASAHIRSDAKAAMIAVLTKSPRRVNPAVNRLVCRSCMAAAKGRFDPAWRRDCFSATSNIRHIHGMSKGRLSSSLRIKIIIAGTNRSAVHLIGVMIESNEQLHERFTTMKSHPWKSSSLALALGLGLLGPSASALSATHNVDIKNFAFSPKDLTINAGDTVVWTQFDAIQHTTTSDAIPRLWDSGLLSAGRTFSHTFDTVGTFPYHCTPHSGTMKATITVQAAVNTPPSVSLTEPAAGSMFTAPATVTLTAVASDSGGTVSRVEFLNGTNSLGAVAVSPFTLTVTNLAFGMYTFTARATDDGGATTESAPVTIMVNSPPTASLGAPGKGAVFLAPATFTLAANVADADGTIDHVEFYDGTNSLAVVTNAPFSLIWTNVPPGSHVITVEAVDDMGAETTSAPVTVTVTGASSYEVQNLVSDLPGLASHTDTNLVNPWGIAFSATGPFWISDNHAGLSTLYLTDGTVQSLVVKVPAPGAPDSPGAPTGMIFNGTTNFALPGGVASRFVFSTEDGTIVAWSAGTNSVIMADNSATNANYKGLALGDSGGNNYLYATDFHNGRIDVFDGSFHATILDGTFADPNLPAGYAPFGIQNIGGSLYVTYAMPDAEGHDDVSGTGHGFVNVFDTSGHLLKRFASGGVLNSPWGVAIAPAGFGEFDGRVLVGNFGDGWINAFDAATGAFVGYLETTNGSPISIEGLWDLKFGNNGRGGDGNRLYFTAGISGGAGIEDHGLFGSISAVSAIEITRIADAGLGVTLSWAGGTPPYLVQAKTSLSDAAWFNVLTTSETTATIPKVGEGAFFRVMDHAVNTVRPFSVRLSGAGETPAIDTAGAGGRDALDRGRQALIRHQFCGVILRVQRRPYPRACGCDP